MEGAGLRMQRGEQRDPEQDAQCNASRARQRWFGRLCGRPAALFSERSRTCVARCRVGVDDVVIDDAELADAGGELLGRGQHMGQGGFGVRDRVDVEEARAGNMCRVKQRACHARIAGQIERGIADHEIVRAQPAVDVEFPHILEDLIGDLAYSPQPIEVKLFSDDAALHLERLRHQRLLAHGQPLDQFGAQVVAPARLVGNGNRALR